METVQVTSTMADNQTLLVHASTESYDTEKLQKYLFTIVYIVFALTTATLIYGLTSWCLIAKFRNYRNYVFLNAILVTLLMILKTTFYTYIASNPVISLNRNFLQFLMINMFLSAYLLTVKMYWVIVICHMFYVDNVKVFKGHIQSRRLKSGLFGWVASLFTSFIYIFVTNAVMNSKSNLDYVVFYVSILPMILNGLLYSITVCTIFRSSDATNNWRRFYIATLIFTLSEVYIFLCNGLLYINRSVLTAFLEGIIGLSGMTILNVYFVVVKRNRKVWHEFFVNKFDERQKKKNLDVKMDRKSVQGI